MGYLEDGRVIDDTLIEEPLQVQVGETLSFIKKHIRKEYIVRDLEKMEIWEYSLESVREALVNAILHRDYFSTSPITVKIGDFGIIVENSGKLPPPLSIEDLRREHPSIPRTPLISRVFFYMGYFEEWGHELLE